MRSVKKEKLTLSPRLAFSLQAEARPVHLRGDIIRVLKSTAVTRLPYSIYEAATSDAWHASIPVGFSLAKSTLKRKATHPNAPIR